MVTNWFVGVLSAVVAWFVGLLPTWAPPDWVSGLSSQLVGVVDNANRLGYWFPLDAIRNIALLLSGALALALAVRVIRIAASFFTAGGGSAA